MKFILFIASRIRPGQFPKLPEFRFSNEHMKYLYAGQPLDMDEFNEACEKVFDEKYRNKGFLFRPMLIEDPPPVEVEAPLSLSDKRQIALDRVRKMNEARAAKKLEKNQQP